jgi:hypothetical protein
MNATTQLWDRIALFLKTKRGLPFCDECIRDEIGTASIQEVRTETESMKNQMAFLPVTDICTRCGERKPGVMAPR